MSRRYPKMYRHRGMLLQFRALRAAIKQDRTGIRDSVVVKKLWANWPGSPLPLSGENYE